MGLRINTNVQAIVSQNNLSRVQQKQSSTLSKLSSGSRINQAADDAAGLAISEKLKASIRGTQQATRNANDGVSLIQTAEGGLNEVSNILIRLRELSVQAASDTVGDQERKFSDLEFQNLSQEVERIAASTQFNGKKLISGEGGALEFQIGTMNNPALDRMSYKPEESDARTATLGVAGLTVLTKPEAQENLEKVDVAINKVNANRATLGALQNRLISTVNNLEVQNENLAAANSRIRDADIAQESAELAKANILTAASTSVMAQANAAPQIALKLIG
ncbi:MAG: flagellin [Pseudomonadota bacterium]